MSKTSGKTVFMCQECGKESAKWLGRCPACHEWNTFVEMPAEPANGVSNWSLAPTEPPQELSSITAKDLPRLSVPLEEFNRVLGGGIVPGSLIMVGGDPGIGKSTLLLQISSLIAAGHGTVLYGSGEETLHQLKLRAERLGVSGKGLYILAETNLDRILQHAQVIRPQMVIIDSIQAVYLDRVASPSGSVTQLRECTMTLMRWAKETGIPTLIVGHVTKEGTIAGPRLLEHIVDAVLYLEGERFNAYRLLRGVKNRFGSTNEVGIFEMSDKGLEEVLNPSQVFLAQRPAETIGSAIVPTLEGTRPILIEIQALTSTTAFSMPRRDANGIDFSRLLMITAVLSQRVGLPLYKQDIIVNVVGGLKINEPAADLGVALAIASSYKNRGIDPYLVAMGEIGLSGELRSVNQQERRLAEAAKLGFRRCLIPHSKKRLPGSGIEVVNVTSLAEAIHVAIA